MISTHDSTTMNCSPSGFTNEDALVQSFKHLAINTSLDNSSFEPPPSPKLRADFTRSPTLRSPDSRTLKSRSSTSSLSDKTSFGHFCTTSPRNIRHKSSSSFINASSIVGLPKVTEDKPIESSQHTSKSIAKNYFKAELEQHDNCDSISGSSDTLVILHDSCYGHRFSRPRTSKSALSNIVERPERIRACILGISVAYVRLGQRHTGGRYPLHPVKDQTVVPNIPFRIYKTNRKLPLCSSTVTNVHGIQWMNELKIMCGDAENRLAMNGKELTRPEMNREANQEAPVAFHEGDLYLCSESLSAIEGALGAVCDGVDAVFRGAASGRGPKRAFVSIRPPGHHCSASYPSGFCWVNNIHVGISHASLMHGLTHAAIIDFDLHHGDGSQAIAWESNKRASSISKNALSWKRVSIGYFSLHDINSYPCEMGDEEKVKNASLCIENSHGQNIWNVHLQPWKNEAEFWKLYETRYSILLEKARAYLRAQNERLCSGLNCKKPKAAIFLSAGFDASEWESSGMQRHKVNVPTEFYARLTRDVVKLADEKGIGVEGRIISVLEGGYSDRALCTGVLSHLSGMAAEAPLVTENNPNSQVLSDIPTGKTNFIYPNDLRTTTKTQQYDPSWWSVPCLEELDGLLSPQATPDKKRQKDCPTTFTSPTQSFMSKITVPVVRKSLPGKLISSSPSSKSPPSIPEVSWAIAAYELSKLLIPTERQTMSNTSENLSVEAMRKKTARIRKENQLNGVSITPAEPGEIKGHMALRIRKPAKLAQSHGEKEVKKTSIKSNQKKTSFNSAQVRTKLVYQEVC